MVFMNMSKNGISIVAVLNELEKEIGTTLLNEMKCLFSNLYRILNDFSRENQTDENTPEIYCIQKPTVKTAATPICSEFRVRDHTDFASSLCDIKIEDLSENNEFPESIQQLCNFEVQTPDSKINYDKVNPIDLSAGLAKKNEKMRRYPKLNSVHICKRCNYTTNCASKLKKHENFHDGIKNFKCESCKTSYFTSYDLKRHFKTITHNQNVTTNNAFSKLEIQCPKSKSIHICKQCNYTTNYASKLKKHEIFHGGIKNFKCKSCNTSYFTSHDLKRHFKTITHNQNVTKSNVFSNLEIL